MICLLLTMCECVWVKNTHVWPSISCFPLFAFCFFMSACFFSFSNHHKISFIFILFLLVFSHSPLHSSQKSSALFVSAFFFGSYDWFPLRYPPSTFAVFTATFTRPAWLQSIQCSFPCWVDSKFVYHTHRGTYFVMRKWIFLFLNFSSSSIFLQNSQKVPWCIPAQPPSVYIWLSACLFCMCVRTVRHNLLWFLYQS